MRAGGRRPPDAAARPPKHRPQNVLRVSINGAAIVNVTSAKVRKYSVTL